MKSLNRATGAFAEEKATHLLTSKGYLILERNFSNRYGELDIIAKDGETTVFVEVKAKIGDYFGLPEDMITPSKLRRVRNMAQIYLDGKPMECRIDIVAVVLTEANEIVRITHYVNVY